MSTWILNFLQVRVDEMDQVRQSKSLLASLSTLHDVDELLYFQRRTNKALTSINSIGYPLAIRKVHVCSAPLLGRPRPPQVLRLAIRPSRGCPIYHGDSQVIRSTVPSRVCPIHRYAGQMFAITQLGGIRSSSAPRPPKHMELPWGPWCPLCY